MIRADLNGSTLDQPAWLVEELAELDRWEADFFPSVVRDAPKPQPLADDLSREVEREESREAWGRDA